MEAAATEIKKNPHAVCLPFPGQGHISAMLKLAKLLHHKGFHITFVHTEYNYNRLLKSSPNSVKALPGFHFETISDGLPPPENIDDPQNPAELYISISTKGCGLFRDLLNKLNKRSSTEADFPPVSCIVSDGVMSFSLEVTQELGLPNALFWTVSAICLMCSLHFPHLRERGYTPLKDQSYFTNGYMEKTIDWIPGIDSIRLKHIPDTIWTTDPDDPYVELAIIEVSRTHKASAVIINSFEALEFEILKPMSSVIDHIYPIGPVHLLLKEISNEDDGIKSNLWKEDDACIDWLDCQKQGSVVYINFGSITTMSQEHLVEFAWGLANSMQSFLWIIRPNLVAGGTSNINVLPEEFLTETKDRGKIASWCNEEKVINHPSVGGFLTHCGWNSTVESLAAGVPMICWPFFADQPTNCFALCSHWGAGMEIDNDVKREEVERVVRELIMGDKGKEMKSKAMEWKKKAEEATRPGGSSYLNLDQLVEDILLSP